MTPEDLRALKDAATPREALLLAKAAAILAEELANAMEELERIAERYCLHTKGDRREDSACLHKPSSEWCSVCVAREALTRLRERELPS